MSKYTAEGISETVKENGYEALLHHDCAICGVWVRYNFTPDGEVYFDPSCGCSAGEGPRLSGFQDIASWLDIQKSDEIRDKILSRLVPREPNA